MAKNAKPPSELQDLILTIMRATPHSLIIEQIAHDVAHRRGEESRRQYVLPVATSLRGLEKRGLIGSFIPSGGDQWTKRHWFVVQPSNE